MATPVLVTSRYVPVGTYIGQIIRPRPGNVAGDARYPCVVGKGDRLALGTNLGIYRSFVYAEALVFPPTAPFMAVLQYQANGSKDSPVRLYKSNGEIVRGDQWYFTASGPTANKAIVINTEAYDSTATYYLDYQSVDRTVLDPLPVDELREVRAVGIQEDQGQYAEYVDFLVVTDVTSPAAATTNANTGRTLEAPSPIVVAGTGTITQHASSTYLHNYTRYYTVKCTGASGVTPNRQATFEWTGAPLSAGNNTLPPVPLHSSAAKPTFTIMENTPATLVQTIEQGIKLAFAFGGTNFTNNDEWEYNALGPGLVEKDDRYNNTNQYTDYSTVVSSNGSGPVGTGLVAPTVTAYAGVYNSIFHLKCTAKAGGLGTYTATFVWAQHGDTQPFASGTFNMNQAVPATLVQSLALGVSITLTPGASNYNVGDVFTFKVQAPFIRYQGKDNRTVTLTATGVVVTSLKGVVSGTYSTDTPEGGFGTWTATAQYGSATLMGKFQLNDNLILAIRNTFRQGLPASSRIATNDVFTFAATNEGYLDWSLTALASESKAVADIYNDVNGAITGTPNTWYTILNSIPVAGTVAVVTNPGGVPVSFTEITGTAFIAFLAQPATGLTITYKYKGQEPDPGQLYFLTATYLRPDNLFDTPILVLARDEGQQLLAPSTAENHLYITNEIMWDHNVAGVYFVQVKDEDGDGIYNNNDYKRAILATEETSGITDRIVLSNFGTLSTELAVNVKANDPFEKRESIDWIGTPIGTAIGDDVTPNTLRYYARNTLQVYGNSPAHGTRVLHGATYCKRTISLDSGVTQQVTLDGSFVGAALAAMVSSFTDPAETILKKTVNGFDEIQTYTEAENVLIGSASMVYFVNAGAGNFTIMEDVTVDTLAPEYQLISGTVQRHNTVKIVRREMEPLVGTVVLTGQAGTNLVRSQLAGILLGLLSRGLIAPYQDDTGAERKFDPSSDILVYQDSSDTTLYHFIYAFWIKKPIKRMFGLYSVDSNRFGV